MTDNPTWQHKLSSKRKDPGAWFDVILAIVASLVVILPIAIWGWACVWSWISDGDSNSGTIRNVGLLVAALIAMRLAIWRSRVAQRQVTQTQNQVTTARLGLLNERYQKGAEMLGSENPTVRLGGIYALQRLAAEDPEGYNIQVMQMFCAFLRSNTRSRTESARNETVISGATIESKAYSEMDHDIQAILIAIGTRSASQIAVESNAEYRLDLQGVKLFGERLITKDKLNFRRAHFHDADLSGFTLFEPDMASSFFIRTTLKGAALPGANLQASVWQDADLRDAEIDGADLSGSLFWGVDFHRASLSNADISAAKFASSNNPSRNLTQSQLDLAIADPNDPPFLEGVVDPETNKPLVWRGKTNAF